MKLMNRHRKILATILLLLIPVIGLQAQEEKKEAPKFGWFNNLVGNLNFTQSQFDNWSEGGEDNLNWQLDLNGKADFKKEKYEWANSGKVSYGRTKIGSEQNRKTSDEINLESVLTYLVNTYINPYAAVSGKTQLTNGYNYSGDNRVQISEFLAPGYFTESFGLGFEPAKDLKIRAGLAFKQTTASETFAFADDIETLNEIETLRSEIGSELVADYTRKLNESILYTGKLKTFSAFDGGDRVDVDWDNIFSANVAKYITVSFNFRMFYDADISSKRQIKQVLAAGLTYSFL